MRRGEQGEPGDSVVLGGDMERRIFCGVSAGADIGSDGQVGDFSSAQICANSGRLSRPHAQFVRGAGSGSKVTKKALLVAGAFDTDFRSFVRRTRMRRKYAGVVLALALTATAVGWAESKNVADYPLRLHIFGRNETNFYHNRAMDEAKGEGRANLFENGEARGVDFNFECSEKIKASFGFETYPAKWKKPGRE